MGDSTTTHPTNVVYEAPLNNPPNNSPQNNNPPINNSPNNNLQTLVQPELGGFYTFDNNTEAENGANQNIQTTNAPAIPEQPANDDVEVRQSGATAQSSSSANSTPSETRPVSETAPLEDRQVHVINVPSDISADRESGNHNPNVETEPQDTQHNEPTPLLVLPSSTPVLGSSAATDEGTDLELRPVNRQVPTETPFARVENPIAPDPPPEPSQLTPVTNQPASEHADALQINPQERIGEFETYAGLRNIDEHVDERAPHGSVIHEKRELMTRAKKNVAQLHDPRAQLTDVTTQASDEDPISQPPSSQPSQQEAQYTVYSLPCYPLHRSEPRGLCLILNMVNFADSFASRSDQPAYRQRVGSHADVTNITHIFQNKLHYIVKLEEDLGKMELLNCITHYLQLPEIHANANALIVFIMSHGEQEAIICADGARVKYSELVNLLSQLQCQTLHGKPKLVFIQACQGDKVQLATSVPAGLGGLFSSRWARTNGTPAQPSMRPSQSTNDSFIDPAAVSSSSTSPSSTSSASAFTANGRPLQSHSQVSLDDQPNTNPSAAQTSSTRVTSSSRPAQPEASSSTVRPPPVQLGLNTEGLFSDFPMEPGNGNGNGIPTRTEFQAVDDPASASDAANASSSNTAIPSSSAGPSVGPSSVSSAPPPAPTPAPRATSAVADAGAAAASAFTAPAFTAIADAAAAAPSAASANPQSSSASANSPTLNLATAQFTLQKLNKQPRADVTTLINEVSPAQRQAIEPIHSSSVGTPLVVAPPSSQPYASQRPPYPYLNRTISSTSNDPYRAATNRTQVGGVIPGFPFHEAVGLNDSNYEPPFSSSSTRLNSSGSNLNYSTSSSVLQPQPTPSPGPSGRLPPWGTENSHTHTGADPASAPAHPDPSHSSSTSAVGRPSNTPATISAQSHEHDDDERDHNERPALSVSSHDEQKEDTNECIPTHGCDLLLGLSTVPDYSSALHDKYGSWYIRSLCEVLDQYAGLPPQGLDIVDMLIIVNDRVATSNGQTAENQPFKQMPCIWYNSLRRKFYFDVPAAQGAGAEGAANN